MLAKVKPFNGNIKSQYGFFKVAQAKEWSM